MNDLFNDHGDNQVTFAAAAVAEQLIKTQVANRGQRQLDFPSDDN